MVNVFVEELKAILGIGLPVCVVYESLEHGSYYHFTEGMHTICIDSDKPPTIQARDIRHEMTHAAQCEHWFGGDGAAFHRAAYDEARGEGAGLIEGQAQDNEQALYLEVPDYE
jgi:hypothetical protein